MDTVKRLVAAGADLWIRNQAGNLAVFEAERAEKDDVVAYLLQAGGTEQEKQDAAAGDDKQEEDSSGATPVNGHTMMGNRDEVDGAAEKLDRTTLNG